MLHLICTLRSGDVTLFEEGGFACQSKAPADVGGGFVCSEFSMGRLIGAVNL